MVHTFSVLHVPPKTVLRLRGGYFLKGIATSYPKGKHPADLCSEWGKTPERG
jgi:hypothetical protein